MKAHSFGIQFFGLLLGAGLCLAATNNAAHLKVELKGIVNVGGTESAYLEFAPPIGGTSSVILREGERMGDIEVVKVDLLQRKVAARIGGTARDLTFGSETQSGILIEPSSRNQLAGNTVGLFIDKMELNQILNLYVSLANRTVLRPCQLPAFELSFYTKENISSLDLMSAIASALKQKDVVIQPHGDKFLIVAREVNVGLVTPEVETASASLAQTSVSKAEELLPAGLINFQNIDLSQAVQIYGDLVDRTVIRPTALPATTVKLFTATSLTRSEVVYSMTATFALNGISVMPAGEKFVFVYPTAQKDMAAGILARKPAVAAAGTNSIPAGSINLNMASLSMVAHLYRGVSGYELELESGLPDVRILFQNQTPLTSAEALQGFDYALGWNQLVIEKKENKFILKHAGAPR